MRALGGFDVHLGAGSPGRGGEDQDAFLRVILNGRRIVYDPRAIVWHYHRRDVAALKRQIRGSGVGLSAIITKLMLQRGTRRDLLSRTRPGFRHLLAPSSPKNQHKAPGFPRGLTVAELLGVSVGPFAYCLSRCRERVLGDAA